LKRKKDEGQGKKRQMKNFFKIFKLKKHQFLIGRISIFKKLLDLILYLEL
jgi:hypothetical protein